MTTHCAKILAVLILYCCSVAFSGELYVKESELKEHEILLGIGFYPLPQPHVVVTGSHPVVVMSYSPHNQNWTIFMPNITEWHGDFWGDATWYTAYCSITEVFYVFVSEFPWTENLNNLVAVDVRSRKVKGKMVIEEPLNKLHCDEETGNLISVSKSGKLVKIDFDARKTITLFSPVHNLGIGSALDMAGERFFYINYRCDGHRCHYSVMTFDFKSQETDESPIFTNCTIEGLFYEHSTQRLYGFLQCSDTGYESDSWTAQVGVMDLITGTFKTVSNLGKGMNHHVAVLTLDPMKRLMYIALDGE